MNSKSIWILSLLMSLTTISESKEFCESFKENGNKISFVFRRMLSSPLQQITYDLFIGNKYWRLKSSDSTTDFKLRFEDKTRESKDTKLRDDYLMATSVIGLGGKLSQSFSVFFSKTDLVYAMIPDDDHRGDKDLIELKELKPDGQKGYFQRPNIRADFAISSFLRNQPSVQLLYKTEVQDKSGETYNALSWKTYVGSGLRQNLSEVDYSYENEFQLNITAIDYERHNKTAFKTQYDIIGVHSMPDTALNQSILILMRTTGNLISYCIIVYNKSDMEQCKTVKHLIDCDEPERVFHQTEALTSSPVTSRDDQSTQLHSSSATEKPKGIQRGFWIIIGVVVFLLVFIAAGILCFCLSSYSGKPEAKTTKPKTKTGSLSSVNSGTARTT